MTFCQRSCRSDFSRKTNGGRGGCGFDSIQPLTEFRSQIFRVLSSEAETRRLESEDQATSDIPCTHVTDHEGGAEDGSAVRICHTYKFVPRYGFLKLAVIRSPDFDQFISSYKHNVKEKK